MSTRRGILITAALVIAAALAVPAIRTPMLRGIGWTLVADDPVKPSDLIIITADSDGAGILEAADLYHAGVAPRVAFFQDPPDAVDQEFVRRGLPYTDAAARSVEQLRELGVTSLEQIPRTVAGTNDEGQVLPDWLAEKRLHSVVVVSVSDHSRRVRRVLHRSMNGRDTTVIVRSSRYSLFDPDRWWQSRLGARTAIVELQKLVLDVALHPIS